MMTNKRQETNPIIYTLQNKERAEFLGRIAFYCFLGSNTYAIPCGQSFWRCHPWDHNPRVEIWVIDENGWDKCEVVKIRYLQDIDSWG